MRKHKWRLIFSDSA